MVDAHVILKSTTMNNITNEELQSKLSRVKSTDTFVEEARALHGDLFDYNKVDYRSITQRVLISCKKHGELLHRRHLHLRRQDLHGLLCRDSQGSGDADGHLHRDEGTVR